MREASRLLSRRRGSPGEVSPQRDSYAKAPRASSTRASLSTSSSAARYGAQVSRSSGVGLFAGGAQRTAAVTNAPDNSRPSSLEQLQGLVRVPGTVQGGEQEVAGAVPGEHPARPVPAIGGRGEARRERGRALGVPEARQGSRPVALGCVRGGAGFRGLPRQATSLGQREQLVTSLAYLFEAASGRSRVKGYGVSRAVISP